MSGARPMRDAVVTINQTRRAQAAAGAGRAPMPPPARPVNSTLVKPIARAFLWQEMLETGRYATIKEIAKAEKINPSYVSRMLRLTLSMPATVEAILHGCTDAAPTLAEAMVPFPVEWARQAAGRRLRA
jgi:hypothetical protein